MSQIQLQPYSVSQGKKETDWWAELTILEQLKQKGQENWTKEEHIKYSELCSLAGQWVTCACGNQCSIIPREHGVPNDHILFDEGINFSSHVDSLNVERAAETLERIEVRSERLIKQILKQNAKST